MKQGGRGVSKGARGNAPISAILIVVFFYNSKKPLVCTYFALKLSIEE